jgi:hypothetical protein
VERFRVLALAGVFTGGGCSGESWLRLEVGLATGLPQPASLSVTVQDGLAFPPPTQVPLDGKALPGSLIVRHLGAATTRVDIAGLDEKGAITSQGGMDLALRSGENDSAITLGPSGQSGGPDGGSDGPRGGSDASPDSAPNKPCPADSLFCDDFESGDTSHWSSSSARPAGVASFIVDGTHAHGSFALDAQTMTYSATTDAEVEQPVTVTAPALIAARFYTYAESDPGSYALFYGQWGGSSDLDGYAVGVDSLDSWVVTQDQGINPDLMSTVTMTFNTFHCVELTIDYVGNQLELDVDGTAVIKTAPTMLTVPKDLEFGFVRNPATAAARVWVDDFAIATHRIGCE